MTKRWIRDGDGAAVDVTETRPMWVISGYVRRWAWWPVWMPFGWRLISAYKRTTREDAQWMLDELNRRGFRDGFLQGPL